MKSRPKSLTTIAILLVGVFSFMIITRGASGIEAIFEDGPWIPRLTLIYLDIVWGSLVVGGIGLFRGSSWSRPLVIVAFVGLWLATVTTSKSSVAFGAVSAVMWTTITALLFTKKAKAFFCCESESAMLAGE